MTRARRGATDLSGILVIDKPAGLTSHDVVAAIRRATGEGRVGHAGTLDPNATGVLVVLVGSATRLTPMLTSADKGYQATVVFGTATDTDDVDGSVTDRMPVPEALRDTEVARAHVAALMGVHKQTPPAFSAIKSGGVVAHRAARSGAPLSLSARTVEITEARLDGIRAEEGLAWEITFRVSKGTYIRALARDLGTSLGTAAHLGALRRTFSGNLTLEDAVALSDVKSAPQHMPALFVDPVRALGLPVRTVGTSELDRVTVGASLALGDLVGADADSKVTVADEQRVWAIYRVTPAGDALVPDVVLAGGVIR